MMRKALFYIVIILTALGNGVAMAADEPQWYLGVGAGRGDVKTTSSWAGQTDATLLAASGIRSSTVIDGHETAWKVFGGYRFNDIIAVEAAYNDLGRYSGTSTITAPAASTAGGSWDASAFSIAAVGTYALGDRFGLLFKGGLAVTRLEASVSQFSKDETRVQPMFGAGAKFDFTKQIGMRVEFERFQNVGDGSTTGQSAINMWSASALYRF